MKNNKILRRIYKLQDLSSKLAQKDFSVQIEVENGNDEIYNLSKDLINTVSDLNDFLVAVKRRLSSPQSDRR